MEPMLHREAAEHGTTVDRLRHQDFTHPVDGVALLATQADDLALRCRAIALALPDDTVFTHLTSARLRGWWLPNIEDEPIIACTDGEAPHHDRRGVYVRRCQIPSGHRHELRGVRVASAEWTIVELAEHLSLVDLTVVIDCALQQGDTSIDRIRTTMRAGRRGVRVLRRALDLTDGRSQSPWETVLRLTHVMSGIAVTPQHQRRDRLGHLTWSLDLRIDGTARAPEFDGAVHRDKAAHARDLSRDKMLARHGIERYGYVADEVRDNPAMIIRDAEDALGLSRDAARAHRWIAELERSSYRPRGYGALQHRLRRFARAASPRRRVAQTAPRVAQIR